MATTCCRAGRRPTRCGEAGGRDQLLGDGGDDDLDGGGDDDGIDPGPGRNTALGGDGADVITLDGDPGERADGGAGDDQLAVGTAGGELVGGPGQDVLTGDAGPDVLAGGEGDDVIEGGEGADRLDGGPGADGLSGGPGADVLAGGSERDRVSYRDVSGGVTVSVDDRADDGGAGEGDDVRGDVEVVVGSGGDDRLAAGAGPAALEGGDGTDTLIGGPAADILTGGADDDLLDGGGGADLILGEDGIDTVSYQARTRSVSVRLGAGTASSGETGEADLVAASVENVQTGSGDDAVTGAAGVPNVIATSAGRDLVRVRDGDAFTDQVACGDGADRLDADELDLAGADCERIALRARGALSVGYVGRRTVRVGTEAVVPIVISCGSGATVRCTGSVRLRDAASKGFGSARFKIAPGQSKAVRVQVVPERVRRLRRGAPRTRVVTARIAAVDLGGRSATVVRRLRIGYRRF